MVPPAPTTLDDLAALRSDDLEALYRAGAVPRDLDKLSGRAEGRLLAIRGVERTPLFHLVARVARSRRFPWTGKSFGTGGGVNRIELPVAGFKVAPFTTRVEASVVDDKPCVLLDYGGLAAGMRDEIREVAEHLYLGPAMLKTGGRRAARLFWFALDFSGRR